MKTEKQLIYKEDVIKMAWLDNECEVVTLSDIENMEPVDAAEVVHGRWERIDKRYVEMFKCSICRSECYVPTCMGEPMYDYCPYCGAKMDGGVQNA